MGATLWACRSAISMIWLFSYTISLFEIHIILLFFSTDLDCSDAMLCIVIHRLKLPKIKRLHLLFKI